MTEVTKIIEWDMGHRVPNHKSKCRNPHGHRYRLEVTIGGPLIETDGASDQGMVIDFSDIKHIITTKVHDVLDHGFMVYENDEIIAPALKAMNDAGADFIVIPVPFIPTAENIVRWCFEQIAPHLPDHTEVSRLRLYETPNSWADYRP
jgi:6-pyruvoyltetrahydropterin/6-carboxytetrahydropterin synthase